MFYCYIYILLLRTDVSLNTETDIGRIVFYTCNFFWACFNLFWDLYIFLIFNAFYCNIENEFFEIYALVICLQSYFPDKEWPALEYCQTRIQSPASSQSAAIQTQAQFVKSFGIGWIWGRG